MGTAGWAKLGNFYLETERFGQSYGLNIFHQNPGQTMNFLGCLIPSEAEELGNSLLYWAKTEKESGREVLKETPKHTDAH